MVKIAIFHDYIGIIGGAEKLVLTLARYMKADIITTDVDQKSVNMMGFEDVKIISIGKTIKLPIFKQISTSIKFSLCNFSKNYDFFIFSGNWSIFGSKKHKPNMYYCHTPMKLFYDLYESIGHESSIIKCIVKIWVLFHRYFYEQYLKHIDAIVANSKNTQLKIQKYLSRDSEVIYPPINCSIYQFKEIGGFWLSVNRLYPEKRIELQTETFRLMPNEKLIIVGSYSEGDYAAKYARTIMKNLPTNVEIRSTISEKELIDLYSRCKGFISTSRDEDFGMAAIEAMASGKPIICTKEGGYIETVLEGKTGLLVKPNVKDLLQAVKILSKNSQQYEKACKEQAKNFDTSVFVTHMKEKIDHMFQNNS